MPVEGIPHSLYFKDEIYCSESRLAVVVTVQQRAAVSLSESHEAIGHRRLGTGSTSSGRYVQDYNGPERIAIRPHSLLPPISPPESPSAMSQSKSSQRHDSEQRTGFKNRAMEYLTSFAAFRTQQRSSSLSHLRNRPTPAFLSGVCNYSCSKPYFVHVAYRGSPLLIRVPISYPRFASPSCAIYALKASGLTLYRISWLVIHTSRRSV